MLVCLKVVLLEMEIKDILDINLETKILQHIGNKKISSSLNDGYRESHLGSDEP